jgi:hypothetical protein
MPLLLPGRLLTCAQQQSSLDRHGLYGFVDICGKKVQAFWQPTK